MYIIDPHTTKGIIVISLIIFLIVLYNFIYYKIIKNINSKLLNNYLTFFDKFNYVFLAIIFYFLIGSKYSKLAAIIFLVLGLHSIFFNKKNKSKKNNN